MTEIPLLIALIFVYGLYLHTRTKLECAEALVTRYEKVFRDYWNLNVEDL